MIPNPFFLLVALNVLRLVLGQVVAAGNRTIDDSSTEFTFTGHWLVNSCSKCNPQPNLSQALNGTWHTNNDDVAAMELQFTGSAIWLFGIRAPAATQGSLTITLDAYSPVVYNGTGTPDGSYNYNELLFSASSLSTLSHSLTLKTGEGSASGHSTLIDYAVVNSDFPSEPTAGSSTSSSNSNLGTIIGPIIGGVILLSIIGGILRRYNRPQEAVTYYEEASKSSGGHFYFWFTLGG
ncbi:hypothetical protein E1B28_003180 [Marasmius oreades]|uniref:Uncharacterized protein n=1 Tax=Marasmius oreades TaxID=181124 RepID=A0A9P7RMJ3_9AGAR|nr:uncharacterized protein E1B28_003180 [Marasmius oreades]KAG7085633.1 hypothetical protein E1B28_003180 [Marasmius oreades]